MANLTIENLGNIVRSGDVETMLTGKGASSPIAPEGPVLREMQANGLSPTQSVSGMEPSSFGQVLKDSIEKVNQYQADADHATKELIAGRNKNIHETMLTVERADTSLKMMMQVRNKVLEAYKEIMKMQV
jgi:flagellar hook-basal body complex protein FliE